MPAYKLEKCLAEAMWTIIWFREVNDQGVSSTLGATDHILRCAMLRGKTEKSAATGATRHSLSAFASSTSTLSAPHSAGGGNDHDRFETNDIFKYEDHAVSSNVKHVSVGTRTWLQHFRRI